MSLTPQIALAAPPPLQGPDGKARIAQDSALELGSELHCGATAMISRDLQLLTALP